MNELSLNGSGAKDPTAYAAILRTEGRGNMDARPGDIWEGENEKGFKRTMLVIAVNGEIASVLGLKEDCDCENRVAVEVEGRTMVSNLAMTQYSYTNALGRLVGKIDGVKLGRIKDRLKSILGMYEQPFCGNSEALNKRISALEGQLEVEKIRHGFELRNVEAENDMLWNRVDELQSQILKKEAEARGVTI